MKKLIRNNYYLIIVVLFANCHVVKSQDSKKTNVLLICVDDLRPELKSFGVDYIKSPNIDALAESGISFHQHFVNAPSCGPSRYTLLTGTYGPSSNNGLFLRARKIEQGNKNVYPSMPEWFKEHGYTTISVGKVSHHPGGMGGKNWDDNSILEMPNAWDKHSIPVGKWEHPKGLMHGLAHGEARKNSKKMSVYQSEIGLDKIYPDGIIVKEAINQLQALTTDNEKPFFLAVGIIKPHLPFGAPKSYYDLYDDVKIPLAAHTKKPKNKTTWHNSNEFKRYNSWGKNPNKDVNFANEVKRHYAACVSYADAQVGKILTELKRTGADKNTIVVLWGDHGWHLGEHAIWGKHSLFEESLHSPLIIRYPGIQKKNIKVNSIVETVDIFPTLCDFLKIEIPTFSHGKSLSNIIENPDSSKHTAVSYYNGVKTIRTSDYRLILHKNGFIELYDHKNSSGEIKNIANEMPDIVENLKSQLNDKLKK